MLKFEIICFLKVNNEIRCPIIFYLRGHRLKSANYIAFLSLISVICVYIVNILWVYDETLSVS